MAGKAKDWRAAERVALLMADRGWTPRDVQTASQRTGHPQRRATARVTYRVVNEGHKPTAALQFEIAAAFGLLPSHIWGNAPYPTASPEIELAVAA